MNLTEVSHILADLSSIYLKEYYFSDCWRKSHLCSVCITVLGRYLWLKSTTLYFFFVINKICQRFVIGLLTAMILVFFLIFDMVSGLLVQLQNFQQL